MKSFTSSLLSARAALVEDLNKVSASLRQKISQIDALLADHDVDVAALGAVEGTAAPKKRRGRKPGSKNAKTLAAAAGEAPVKEKKAGKAKKAPKAKKAGRRKRGDGFNATGAVRAIVAEMKKPFTVGELREEFEKRHPGVLATLNRIVLSLALQSMGRKGEVTGKKDPNGKGNLFTKTAKLKA